MPERYYQIARRGLATNFTETEIPLDYAQRFRNRFINAAGGAEKRPGYVALSGALPTKGIVTGLHEYVDKDGTATLFASSDGIVFRYNGSSAWTQVWQATTAARIRSVQFDEKLVLERHGSPGLHRQPDRQFRAPPAPHGAGHLRDCHLGCCADGCCDHGLDRADLRGAGRHRLQR